MTQQTAVKVDADMTAESSRIWPISDTKRRTFISGLNPGEQLHPFQPEIDDIAIETIARSLANTCRFGGMISAYYSVAQHCVIASYILEDEGGIDLARAGFLHDAGEALWGDDVSPRRRWFPERVHYETRATQHVMRSLGVEPALLFHPLLIEVDQNLLATEMRDLKSEPAVVNGVAYDEVIINPMPPSTAYRAFAERFAELFPDRVADTCFAV